MVLLVYQAGDIGEKETEMNEAVIAHAKTFIEQMELKFQNPVSDFAKGYLVALKDIKQILDFAIFDLEIDIDNMEATIDEII